MDAQAGGGLGEVAVGDGQGLADRREFGLPQRAGGYGGAPMHSGGFLRELGGGGGRPPGPGGRAGEEGPPFPPNVLARGAGPDGPGPRRARERRGRPLPARKG